MMPFEVLANEAEVGFLLPAGTNAEVFMSNPALLCICLGR